MVGYLSLWAVEGLGQVISFLWFLPRRGSIRREMTRLIEAAAPGSEAEVEARPIESGRG